MWDWGVLDLSAATAKMCCMTTPDLQEGIDEDAFENGIFHSPQLREARRKMLVGERPSACSGCWKMEDAGNQEISPRRTVQSLKDYWSQEINGDLIEESSFPGKVVTLQGMSAVTAQGDLRFTAVRKLQRIQLILSSTCNLKCWYCNENNSSYWEQYKRKQGQLPSDFKERKVNPRLLQKSMSWLARRMEDGLEELNVSGGEPALCKEFYELAEFLKEAKPFAPRLTMDVLSNLGFREREKEKFFSTLMELSEIFPVCLSVSMDAFGRRAEFIRDPLDWSRWDRHFREWLALSRTNDRVQTRVRTTFSALNLHGLKEFYRYLFEASQSAQAGFEVVDNIVVEPSHLSPYAVPASFSECLTEPIRYLQESAGNLTFFSPEQKVLWGERTVSFLEDLAQGLSRGQKPEVDSSLKVFLQRAFAADGSLREVFREFDS